MIKKYWDKKRLKFNISKKFKTRKFCKIFIPHAIRRI